MSRGLGPKDPKSSQAEHFWSWSCFLFSFQSTPTEVCSWLAVYPTWFIVGICAIYFFLLCLVGFMYSVILFLYRISKKKIQTTIMDANYQDPTKKRETFVQRSLLAVSNMIAHVKSANYVLSIVLLYLISWAPFFIHCIINSLENMKSDSMEPSSEVLPGNIRLIENCLRVILVDKQKCESTIELDKNEIELLIRNILATKKIKMMNRLLGTYFSLLSCFGNPILYAFWYPAFRASALRILNCCRKPCNQKWWIPHKRYLFSKLWFNWWSGVGTKASFTFSWTQIQRH